MQREFEYAIEVFDEFLESQIFVIPCRLDECEIPYDKPEDIEYVDLFPNWEEGMRRILQATGTPPDADKGEHKAIGFDSTIEVPIQNTKSTQKLILSSLFEGEKEFWEKSLPRLIKPPGSRVSIVGPGGSG